MLWVINLICFNLELKKLILCYIVFAEFEDLRNDQTKLHTSK